MKSMARPQRLLVLGLPLLLLLASCVAAQETETAPEADVCSSSSDSSGAIFNYEYLVHCTSLQHSLALARTLMIVILMLLLYLLSSTADVFFCPVLQTIVEKYEIPPNVAGVTFLSFGNGSPDVFSNIAAFTSSTPTIGMTSILGGGLLVTTVVAACVGLVSQGEQQLVPRTYVRDVGFYCIAVLYFFLVFFDGVVHLTEAFGFLAIYSCYVAVVLLDNRVARVVEAIIPSKEAYESRGGIYTPVSPMVPGEELVTLIPLHSSGKTPNYGVFAVPEYPVSDSDTTDSPSSMMMPSLYRKTSEPTPRSNSIEDANAAFGHRLQSRPSLLERTDDQLKRPATVCVSTIHHRKSEQRRKSTWESVESSVHFGPTARRWTRSYHLVDELDEFVRISDAGSLNGFESGTSTGTDEEEEEEVVFDSIQAETHLVEEAGPITWLQILTSYPLKAYSAFDRLVWYPFEFTTTFIRRLTIPLVDEDTWDKTLTTVCPPFAILVIGVAAFGVDVSNLYFLLTIVIGGGLASAYVAFTTSPLLPPQGKHLLPYVFVGFVMSVIWIMAIANEVLAVLETLGGLFGISNAVLGVSVLAWGNSIGDLVSNTAIARDGFPTMAFAGCFAGPMFNLLFGIGLAVTIGVLTNGPIATGKPSPLVILGFVYLLSSLVLNLLVASYDGFVYRKRLCYCLLALYMSFAILSVIVVMNSSAEA